MTELQQRETDLEVNGPAGLGFKFRGSNTLLLVTVLFLIVACVLLFFLQQHEVAASTREAAGVMRDGQTQALLKQLVTTNEAIAKNQDVHTFMLTQNEKERKQWNLRVPDRLREMQR